MYPVCYSELKYHRLNFMNLNSIQLGTSFRLMLRTLPIIGIRLGANLLFWIALLIYLAIAGWVAYLVGNAIQIVGIILFIVAIVAIIPIYSLAYRYVFYMLKAAHIAVIAELLANGKVPEGRGQLDWGRQKVQSRFGEMNAMFLIDELVSGVVRAFTRTVFVLTAWLPGDTLYTAVRMINRVIEYAMNYIDEAVLARSFWTERESVWANARDGVVLYAMVWKPILMNAIALMILSYVPFVVVFILFSAPIGFLLSQTSPQLAGWSIIATLVLSYLIKVAVGDAFAMTAIIAAYQRETASLTPDPDMVAKLDSVSNKFGELKKRAAESIGQMGSKPATAAESPQT
jgi:hypothetical protein